jgi:hypothetical protein
MPKGQSTCCGSRTGDGGLEKFSPPGPLSPQRCHRFRGTAGLALVFLLAAFAAADAHADGDPASDTLIVQDAYVPYPAPPADATAQLTSRIRNVYAAGYRIKVAVIATRVDLGAVPQLFGKPDAYARFLGTELAPSYIGPLLIAMPNGYGIYDGGRSTIAETRVLADLKPDRSSAASLVRSTSHAVERLLAGRTLRSKDVLRPAVYPQVPFTSAGSDVRLTFSILEDSERASAVVTVIAQATLATFRLAMRDAAYAKPWSVKWHVPDPAPTGLRFCVIARDATGNRSRKSCLPIRVN